MGYEPDLLVLMERETDMDTKRVDHVATVMKDRSTELDGKKFTNPTFQSFLPHIAHLNLGGVQLGIDTSRTSEDMLVTDKKDWNPVQRRIVVDEIQSLMVLHIPGQAAADKKRKLELLRKHFDASWTEIEEVMTLLRLRAGYDSLHRELEGKPSRYASKQELMRGDFKEIAARTEPLAQIMNDEIPSFDAQVPLDGEDKVNILAAG